MRANWSAGQRSTVTLSRIQCLATQDATGDDDLIGVMGMDRFTIGKFRAGETREVGLERSVPEGVTTLQIFEGDDFDSDDFLTTLDLTQEMDTARIHSITEGDTRYVIHYGVLSQTE